VTACQANSVRPDGRHRKAAVVHRDHPGGHPLGEVVVLRDHPGDRPQEAAAVGRRDRLGGRRPVAAAVRAHRGDRPRVVAVHGDGEGAAARGRETAAGVAEAADWLECCPGNRPSSGCS
jgi:hypothetical protein